VSDLELILALGAVACALALVARAVRLPPAIVQMAGGLAIALIPGLPAIQLPPDLIFVLFVPPLVYVAGFNSSLRDLRANAGAIASLAVGLVLVTAGVIAVIAHELIPGLPWAAALALGAIVAPTDIVATQAILQRLGLPRPLVALLDGEGLMNDATAVITYRVAVAAVVVGGALVPERFIGAAVLVGLGGLVAGLALGVVISELRRRVDDPLIVITISLLTPYVVYLAAEAVDVSGVLAAVVAGILIGRRRPTTSTAQTRIAGVAVWELVLFLLNSAIFLLLGLMLPGIVASLGSESVGRLLGLALAIGVAVIVVRLLWTFPVLYWMKAIPWLHIGKRPDWRQVAIVGWAGARGMDSITTALALPLMTGTGQPFPARSLLVFLATAVVLITLIGQGLTLPFLMRLLGVARDTSAAAEEARAREMTGDAALRRLDELEQEWPTHRPLIDQLRTQYEHRAEHLDRRGVDARAADQEEMEHRTIRREVFEAERAATIDLRNRNVISDGVLRVLERDIDLEELRMDA